MMDYKNRTNRSCVYDAFERAGLPFSGDMLSGVMMDDVISLLQKNGYTVFTKGATVSLPNDKGFFIIFDCMDKKTGHIEYHVSPDGITEYPEEMICAVAVKM